MKKRRNRKKTYNPLKLVKSLSRKLFMGSPKGTRVHKDKNKYNRKVKHKKNYKDEI